MTKVQKRMAYTVESLLMSGTLKFYLGSKVLKTPTPSLAKNPALREAFAVFTILRFGATDAHSLQL